MDKWNIPNDYSDYSDISIIQIMIIQIALQSILQWDLSKADMV